MESLQVRKRINKPNPFGLRMLHPPFKPCFDANDLQHNKTNKLTKTLANNKTKSLTNIS
jgi:hypothetical protein